MPIRSTCMTRDALRTLAIAVLIAAKTDAGISVFAPRDWPESPRLLPALAVQTPSERKENLARGQRQFNTTITLAILARVTGSSGGDTEEALERLCAQVENAILSSQAFTGEIQQFTRVETAMVVDAGGEQPIGEASVVFDVEVFQIFDPDGPVPLVSVLGTVTHPVTNLPLIGVPVSLPIV